MESHMEFFVGQDLLADDFEDRGAAAFANGTVVFQGDDLRHQENRNLFMKSQQVTASTEQRIGPMMAQEGRIQLMQDVGQEPGMFLLFGNEQFDGVRVRLVAGLSGEPAGPGFQARAIGTFTQLKTGE